jgi:hypothetical protein
VTRYGEKLTWPQVLAWRMERQFLDPIGKASVEEVVARLGAIQAQSDLTLDLSVGLRHAQPRVGEVAAAYADGRVIKAYTFRGATHLMTPESAATYLRLRAASKQWELRSWQTFYKLPASDWPGFRAAVRGVLANGPLTLKQFSAAVVADRRYKHLGAFFPDKAWTLIKALMWQGDICFAPPIDGQATFQRLDANPRWPGLPELDDAGRRATEHYFAAYGPATPAHLQRWLGEGLSAGRKRVIGWFEDLRGRLAEFSVEGKPAFVLKEHADQVMKAKPTDTARLLPAYDQWLMGAGTNDPHVVPADKRVLVSGGRNVVIVGGVVAGTWALKGDDMKIDWFKPRGAPTGAAVGKEVERIAKILGRTITADG